MVRAVLNAAVLLVALGSTAVSSSPSPATCGDCDPPLGGWGAISHGAYRFHDEVPDNVRQAAYFAEDEGWGQYHDQGDGAGVLIRTYFDFLDPTITGGYDPDENVLLVDRSWATQECQEACAVLIKTINHEFGHALGFMDFFDGCEDSIMSYESDLFQLGPSDEDLCWFYNVGWGSGPHWECPEEPCVPYFRLRSLTGSGAGS